MHTGIRRVLPPGALTAAAIGTGAFAAWVSDSESAAQGGDDRHSTALVFHRVTLCEPAHTLGRRDLRALPKAHVHLHERSNCVRRDTLEDLAKLPGWRTGRQMALETAQARSKGRGPWADKYRRRADLLAEKDPVKFIDACFGRPPPPNDAPESAVVAHLCQLDASTTKPRSCVWDAQFVARALLDSDPGAEIRVLRELYEDAELESIRWVEVCSSLPVKHGAVSPVRLKRLHVFQKSLYPLYESCVGRRFETRELWGQRMSGRHGMRSLDNGCSSNGSSVAASGCVSR